MTNQQVKRHSETVFAFLSDHPLAGESTYWAITIKPNGANTQVLLATGVVDEAIDERSLEAELSASSIAQLLATAIGDTYFEGASRLLSLVAHNLLPQGDYIDERLNAGCVPDHVLGGAYGYRTWYSAHISDEVLAELRTLDELKWASEIQDAGAPARLTLMQCLMDTAQYDNDWLFDAVVVASTSNSHRFAQVVRECAPPAVTGTAHDAEAKGEREPGFPIFWDEDSYRFCMVPEGWFVETLAPLKQLIAARTWGEVLALELPGWLEGIVECAVQDREEEGLVTEAGMPFSTSDLRVDQSSLLDCMVVPWESESIFDWFPDQDLDVFEAHCESSGGSPGGHISSYRPRNREAFFLALRERGYEVQRGEVFRELVETLDLL